MRFFTAGSKPAKQWSRSVDNRDSTAQIQDCSEGLSFLRFLCETEISLQSGAHFAGLIFQKCSAHLNSLRTWSANRALATVRCTFCRQLCQIEAQNRGNGNPTSATPGATLPEQKHRVRRPRAFSPVSSHASELLRFPTAWWWVVDWWCGWYDGGNADHDQSSAIFLTNFRQYYMIKAYLGLSINGGSQWMVYNGKSIIIHL